MDAVEAMKAELERMRVEKICMEARLIAEETELDEKKRVLSKFKAMAIAMEKLADDLLEVVLEAGDDDDNVHGNNGQDLDEETLKELTEEATRDFTEALNQTQSLGSRPADDGNGGSYDGSTGSDDHSKEAGGSGGGKKGGNSCE